VLDKKKKMSEVAKKSFLATKNKKDLENYIVARIYEHSVFKEMTNEHGGIYEKETAESEATFREIVPSAKD